MAIILENIERKVIPNFRSSQKTFTLGELNSYQVEPKRFEGDITSYLLAFSENKEIPFAADLLSAALVNRKIDNPLVAQAAEFIINANGQITKPQKALAESILGINAQQPVKNIDRIDEFLETNAQSFIHQRIRHLKYLSQNSIANPFVFSELARLYSIIAQKDKALKNLKIALGIAPSNRYVIRSLGRLLANLGDIDIAHDVLKSAPNIVNDPWLIASEISLASLRGRGSMNVKRGIQLLGSKNYDPFSVAELASAIGTLEITNGNRNKAKSFFRQSLISPNDNALAQFEWINNKDRLLDVDVSKFNVRNSYEALTFDNFYKENWTEALANAERWFIDMPFATRSANMGHHIASVFLEDYPTAIKFCEAAMISNPNDPMLINNLAYSYALYGMPNKSIEILNKVTLTHVSRVETRICLKATTGLVYFRSGFPDNGRKLYLDAIKEASENDLDYYRKVGLLHLIREELRLRSSESKSMFETIDDIKEDENKAIKILKKRIITMYKMLDI